jgi:hypothetical protein
VGYGLSPLFARVCGDFSLPESGQKRARIQPIPGQKHYPKIWSVAHSGLDITGLDKWHTGNFAIVAN